MQIHQTAIKDVFKISTSPIRDARGHFARTFCADEIAQTGLELPAVQMAISHNSKMGTLRGLHFIPEEVGEVKLVRCIRGVIFDVAVDLRPRSPTIGQWVGYNLSEENMDALLLPRGVAHGFITLSDNADILYQFSQPFREGIEIGIAWNDPDIDVKWPIEPRIISSRDKSLPTWEFLQAQI